MSSNEHEPPREIAELSLPLRNMISIDLSERLGVVQFTSLNSIGQSYAMALENASKHFVSAGFSMAEFAHALRQGMQGVNRIGRRTLKLMRLNASGHPRKAKRARNIQRAVQRRANKSKGKRS